MKVRMSVFLPYHPEFEICAPMLRSVGAIEQHCAINPNLLSFGVDAERIAGPKHHIGILADLNRTDLVVEIECPGGIDGQPTNCLILSDHNARGAPGVHRFGDFLIEPLSSISAVRMNHCPRAERIRDGEVSLD